MYSYNVFKTFISPFSPVSRSHSESESTSTLTNAEEDSSVGELSPKFHARLEEAMLKGPPPPPVDEAGAWGQPETVTAPEDPAAAAAASPRTQLEIQRSQGAIPKRRLFTKSPDSDKRSSSQGTFT